MYRILCKTEGSKPYKTQFLNHKHEGCSKNDVRCGVFRGKRVHRVKNLVRPVECLLNCNISKKYACKYTELGTVYMAL